MTRPARPLLISYIIFGIATALFIAAMIVGASEAARGVEAVRAAETASKEQTTIEPTTQPAAQEAVENKASEPSSRTSSPATVKDQAAAPQPAIGEEAPEPRYDGGHIPFTNDPVTPGDPESYVDTVGQCPFYEMAGPKGCYPPADIECNADWSVCTYKGGPVWTE